METLLVTAKQAAGMLAIGETKLRELTQANEIKCVRIGRAVRYAVADLQTYIEKHKGA